MKSKFILAGIGTLALGGLIAPQLASAYRGDPSVQGPDYSVERHEAVTAAFEAGDYDAWSGQMEGRGVARKINESNFARFAEAHRLTLAGDTVGAAKVRAELGLGQQDGSGQGQGQGQGTGYGKNR